MKTMQILHPMVLELKFTGIKTHDLSPLPPQKKQTNKQTTKHGSIESYPLLLITMQ